MTTKQRVTSLLYSMLPIIILLLIWETLSRLELLNPALVSQPSEILRIMLDLLNPFTESFLQHSIALDMLSSLYRLLVAFIAATIFGIGLGLLMGKNKLIYGFFDPIITFIMPIPGIAWTPIFILLFGFGNPTIITVGAFAGFFPIVYNTAMGVRNTDKKLIWSAQTAGANNKAILTKIIIPSSAPFIFTGFKLALARGWRTIIAVEMIAGTVLGLGYVIFDARDYLRPSIIYAGIVLLALTYFLIENLIKLIEKRTIERWGVIHT